MIASVCNKIITLKILNTDVREWNEMSMDSYARSDKNIFYNNTVGKNEKNMIYLELE